MKGQRPFSYCLKQLLPGKISGRNTEGKNDIQDGKDDTCQWIFEILRELGEKMRRISKSAKYTIK